MPASVSRSITAPILLGLLCLLVYNANMRVIGSGDTFPARYLPLILWQQGTLGIHANARLVAHGHSTVQPWRRPPVADGPVTYLEPWAYWMVRTHEGRLASLYPMVTPLIVAPLYLPVAFWIEKNGWGQPRIDRVAELMEKVSASVLASAASVVTYLVLRRDGTPWSLPLALAFAFGTNTWMISSQALWQHGAGELLIALALLLSVVTAAPLRTALLGAVCALMAANRPPDALVATAFGLFALWRLRLSALWLLPGAALPLAALLYYNLGMMGDIAGGYGLAKTPANPFFRLDWAGVPGLLVSPARGLLVFAPFFLFLPAGLMQRVRTADSRPLALALSAAVVAQVLLYSQADWRAGVSWGPRWMTDLLSILVWLLAPAPLVLRPIARRLLVAAIAASIGIQTVGAFRYTGTSDERIFGGNPASMAGAWDPNNLPFLVELQHPPASRELLCDALGSLDLVGTARLTGLGDVPELKHGAPLEGWALTCGRTPAQLLVLIDGIVVGATAEFLPRPDVDQAMRSSAPAGWRVLANTRGIEPGERVLQLATRIEPRSDIRIIREQRVSVLAQPSELEIMAERAAALLREHQAAEGYWLTVHTKSGYEAPQPEMNTFLTSMLVDTLSRIARQHSLEDAVERARRHLAAQIEPSGLVRYHGLPDGPLIGRLGCAITPDADDTALVWRIAALDPGDPRTQSMLAELAGYRDARGLYRTWLAAQRDYRCIDPGRDPNPPDVAIQMHVYLMLRQIDPPAAQNLCVALQHAFLDDDLWVYYKQAPLLPYLRAAELSGLGCPLPLPAERLARLADGQETWAQAARLLVQLAAAPDDAAARAAARDLLARLSNDDFAQLRRTPPLLYHNDLTATVSRFYWSEDFGYALWLRLYEAAGLRPGQPR
ncbi:MAG: hypothetical protein U0821_04340 [Chloroflexota bacterium]